MGRATGTPIHYVDAQYMVDNEGYTAKKAIPATNQLMTRAKIEEYLEVDTSNFSSYASNRLVPYQLISPAAVDTQAPDFPYNTLTLTNSTESSISMSWSNASDDVGVVTQKVWYKKSTDPNYVTAATWNNNTQSSYTRTGLIPNTSYKFYVSAQDAEGNIGYTNTLTVSTTYDTTAPTFPSNALSVTGENATSISLAWQAASDNVGVTQYKIWRKKTSEQGYVLHTTLSNTVTNYTVSGLDTNTSYNFFVEALDDMNNEGSTNTVTHSTSAPATLSISPTSVYKGQGGGSFTLNITTTAAWTLSDNASWLSATSTSGTGNTSVTINYAPNAGNFRSGTITVSITGSNKYCYVDQEGGGGGFEEPL